MTAQAEEWRHLLFPRATNGEFADGYAQAVTFGLLLARSQGISLDHGVGEAADQLGRRHSLIGRALDILTHEAIQTRTLVTSVSTLTRVLAVVD